MVTIEQAPEAELPAMAQRFGDHEIVIVTEPEYHSIATVFMLLMWRLTVFPEADTVALRNGWADCRPDAMLAVIRKGLRPSPSSRRAGPACHRHISHIRICR